MPRDGEACEPGPRAAVMSASLTCSRPLSRTRCSFCILRVTLPYIRGGPLTMGHRAQCEGVAPACRRSQRSTTCCQPRTPYAPLQLHEQGVRSIACSSRPERHVDCCSRMPNVRQCPEVICKHPGGFQSRLRQDLTARATSERAAQQQWTALQGCSAWQVMMWHSFAGLGEGDLSSRFGTRDHKAKRSR